MKWAVILTWKMSMEGNAKAAEMLADEAKAGDAIVEGVTLVEDNPNYCSVGYSGLPDKDGRITLDGGYMDGDTLQFGAVGCIEGFRSPVRIARKLSENSFNNFLVGKGAEKYARQNGFEERDNMTPETFRKYLRSKDKLNELKSYDGHDTVCFIGKDVEGSVCAAVSTSGLFMKEPGRVGDSPVAGCGFYADSAYGGAGVTGVGEDCIRGTVSFRVVNKMAQGKTPQQAVEETMRELSQRIENLRHMSIIALNRDGEFGVATNCVFPFVYASDECEQKLYLATWENDATFIKEIRPEDTERD